MFIRWCHENYHIKEVPRNLRTVLKAAPVDRGGKPIPLADLRKLWDAADPQMRCFICLGLNCGFKNSDVSALRRDEVINGRVIKRRGKTGVPMNYKLWGVTQRLIEQTGNREGDLLLTCQNGEPLTQQDRCMLGRRFGELAKSVGVQATFSQLRDNGADAIRAYTMRQGRIDPALVQIYLAHKDSSTASFYVSNDPHAMETAALDRALEAIEKEFGLEE